MLLRRAGLTASAGLSCYKILERHAAVVCKRNCVNITAVVIIFCRLSTVYERDRQTTER